MHNSNLANTHKNVEGQALDIERVMGFEPTISCLGSMRSTTELHPLEELDDYKRGEKGMSSLAVFFE